MWERNRQEAEGPLHDRIDRLIVEYRGDEVHSGASWMHAYDGELRHQRPMETFTRDTSIDRVLAWMARPANPRRYGR